MQIPIIAKWMYYKIFNPKGIVLTEEATEPEVVEQKEFSTDLGPMLAKRRGALEQYIHQNMFQKTHKDFKMVGVDGVAMDSAESFAMDSSVKGAYSLSSSNLPMVLFSWYVKQGFIGYQACAVIAQQWLVNKACTIPARDAIKNGYELSVNDGSDVDAEIIAEIRKLDKKFKIKQNLVEFHRFSRIFGIRIALFVVESTDKDYYAKPYNPDGIRKGSYKGISQVDPYWVSPELDEDATANPASTNFYEPTWWRIAGKRYHRSHLVITRYSEVPDVLKPSYMYGGLPLPQLIFERIYAAERTANEAPLLALTKRVNVVKVDTDVALQNQKKFEERMETFNQLRDNHGIYAIDKDEEFQQTDTSLNDLDALTMTQYQLVAAIAGVPANKLIETSPKGFSATGAFEQESYYDSLEGIQVDNTPLLDRHYELLIRSEIAPKKNIDPFELEVTWNPLKSPSDLEIADINSKNAATDTALQLAGAIDGEDVRKRIIADPTSGYSGLEAFDSGVEE